MFVCEVVVIEKKVEQGAIGLTFNSKLSMKMCGPILNSSLMVSPIGYVHVAPIYINTSPTKLILLSLRSDSLTDHFDVNIECRGDGGI